MIGRQKRRETKQNIQGKGKHRMLNPESSEKELRLDGRLVRMCYFRGVSGGVFFMNLYSIYTPYQTGQWSGAVVSKPTYIL